MEFNELIAQKLNQHRGKFANVVFTKKDGTERSMNFMQGVKKGLKSGGIWANGTVEKPSDLMLVSDLQLYRKFKQEGLDDDTAIQKSRRSFKIPTVKKLTIAGETYTRKNLHNENGEKV